MKIFNITEEIKENLAKNELQDELNSEFGGEFDFIEFIENSSKENPEIEKITKDIILDVKNRGDQSLIEACNKFDGANFLNSNDLFFSDEEIENSEKFIDEKVKKSLEKAFTRIKNYHQKQLPKDFIYTDEEGVELGNLWKSIESVGVYTPGGTASYPSSVLMSAVPALVAGVKNIAISAPTSGGKINKAVLYAAKLCGVKKIYKVGGASAIAAFALGTKTIQKVNKIVGPGNAFVAEAKRILFGKVGIDSIAGPTDITIIADEDNNPAWIAADALSQLEHGIDSKAFIICDSENFAKNVVSEINKLKKSLNREKIIDESIKNSAIFIIKNISDSYKIANFIAPEHLEISTKNNQEILDKISNAGAIFVGKYTTESIGDYMAGPSHTLPTSASSKFSSGLSVYDFLKRVSLISCNEKAFRNIADETSILAQCEGLDAHKLSVEIRKNKN